MQAHSPWTLYLEPKGMDESATLPVGWSGDGVIAAVRTASTAKLVKNLKLPVINLSAIVLPGAEWPRVLCDEEGIARMAFLHLRERGFVNFAYVGSNLSYVHTRAQQYIHIVEDAGYTCSAYMYQPEGLQAEGWATEIKSLVRWLRGLPKPVALACWNPMVARRVVEVCKYAKVHVPEEVAIIAGSSDDLMIEMVQPPLSAVELPLEKLGYEAAALLDKCMQGQTVPDIVTMPPLGVSFRQSTDVLAVDQPEIREALRFIREHSNQPIGVPDILNAVPISRRVLERNFKKILGRTPLEEIRRVHLEKAKNLLANTNQSIPRVASASGFQWVEHFITVFRKEVGMTPLAYRKHAHPK